MPGSHVPAVRFGPAASAAMTFTRTNRAGTAILVNVEKSDRNSDPTEIESIASLAAPARLRRDEPVLL